MSFISIKLSISWDLRLEMGGVLRSWAVPKEPPLVPGLKRLAVQVEDHPLDYAGFEGIIPKGEYGAGKVEIWGRGSFDLIEKTEDKLVVNIKGRKLRGGYVLLRLKKPKADRNWLFFKKKD